MNEKNLTYLKENLRYHGFGASLHDALRSAVLEDRKDFTLSFKTELNARPFSALLHFRRGDSTDNYFFNKWEGTLESGQENRRHTFYLNQGQGITLKEGFNLLEGRAVYKELTSRVGGSYRAWLQLDRGTPDGYGNHRLRQYYQSYGYRLEEVLSGLPVRELARDGEKEWLLYSLEKGNRAGVTFEKNGFAEKLYIEAAPQDKSIHVYDHNGTRIPLPELEQRFELSLGKERPGLSVPGPAKVNAKEVEGTGGYTPPAGSAAQKEQPEKPKHQKVWEQKAAPSRGKGQAKTNGLQP